MNLALCTCFLIVAAVYPMSDKDRLMKALSKKWAFRMWYVQPANDQTNLSDSGQRHQPDSPRDLDSIKKSAKSSTYPFHESLDENFQLNWDYNLTHIVFETLVKTNGFIGFGFTMTRTLNPADVILGWVLGGEAHFADRHTARHSMPVMDRSQDWQLVNGYESGNYTMLTMIRKLDTCDCEDIAIKEGVMNVIYSYYPSDPKSDDMIPYLGGLRRGTKSMFLINPPTRHRETKPLPWNVFTFDFLNQNFSVPSTETTQSCTMLKLPPLVGKHHVIRFEPVVQEGHEKLVDHVILFFCSKPIDESLVGTRNDCYQHLHNGTEHPCGHTFLVWAPGGTGFDFPDHVGYSLGSPGDPVYFMMQTHYNNPDMRSDFVDNSGLRLFLTQQLRQYDGGVLQVGVDVGPHQVIPPYDISFFSQGFCHPDCLAEALEDTQIHVFANILRANLLGTRLRTRIIRNGVELPPLQEDNNFEPSLQEIRPLPEERILKKGDGLIVECDYDSSQRTNVTFGGRSRNEEMCLSVLYYYPRSALTTCASRSSYPIEAQVPGPTDIQMALLPDWTKQEVQDRFLKDLRESDEYNVCRSSGNKFEFDGRLTPKINVTQKYQYPQTCPIKI